MTQIKFRKGVCYVGLADVFGGKMWHHWNEEKQESEKSIRNVYRDAPETRRELLNRLFEKRGKAYFYQKIK